LNSFDLSELFFAAPRLDGFVQDILGHIRRLRQEGKGNN